MGFTGLLSELWAFMKERKKLWLLPILVLLLLVGGLLVFAPLARTSAECFQREGDRHSPTSGAVCRL